MAQPKVRQTGFRILITYRRQTLTQRWKLKSNVSLKVPLTSGRVGTQLFPLLSTLLRPLNLFSTCCCGTARGFPG